MSSNNEDATYHNTVEEGKPDDDGVVPLETNKSEQNKQPAKEEDSIVNDLDTMKNAVWFLHPDRNRRLSQFWLLIFFASIIATTGVASDSSATVIGAMIVAPLMTPILGTMLSIVLADLRNFGFSFLLVVTGAGCAVLIGYLYGLIADDATIYKENNSQIAARVEPKLPDLFGALATGAVGSIALVRRDIAGTLPGVAIAISLVPPLCVAGLSFSAQRVADGSGALLLFATNFVSILFVGVTVMYTYRVHRQVQSSRSYRTLAFAFLFVLLAVVGLTLSVATARLRKARDIEQCLRSRTDPWAEKYDWGTQLVVAREQDGKWSADIYVSGSPPFPTTEDFPQDTEIPCDVDQVDLFFLPQGSISFGEL